MKTPLKPISEMVDNISEHLAEMRKESELLMQIKIHETLQINQRMERELKVVRVELEAARRKIDGKSEPQLSSVPHSLTVLLFWY
jgi:hypothetical protein